MSAPRRRSDEARLAKALAHPLRARILDRLGAGIMSPGDLADEFGEPIGVVSYHVRMLLQYECVELVRTEPRRGALQHFYRATVRAPRVTLRDDVQLARWEAALRHLASSPSNPGTMAAIAQMALDGTLQLPIRAPAPE